MSAQPQPSGTDPSGSDYEDLLGQWSDLESALSALLARPRQARDFVAKVRQCDR